MSRGNTDGVRPETDQAKHKQQSNPQPGTAEYARLVERRIELEVQALHRVASREITDYDKVSFDTSFRQSLRRFYEHHTLSRPSPKELAVTVAARSIAMMAGGVMVPGKALCALYQEGEYPVATYTLDGSMHTRFTAHVLMIVNLLPSLAAHLYAGGSIAASPSCLVATIYFAASSLGPGEHAPTLVHQTALQCLTNVCAMAITHKKLMLQAAEYLITADARSAAQIDFLFSTVGAPKHLPSSRSIQKVYTKLMHEMTRLPYLRTMTEEAMQ